MEKLTSGYEEFMNGKEVKKLLRKPLTILLGKSLNNVAQNNFKHCTLFVLVHIPESNFIDIFL